MLSRTSLSRASLVVFLAAALLPLACTAPPPDDIPNNPDADGDGIDDSLLVGRCLVDADGDGQPDEVDLDMNGMMDGKGFDVDCNGAADGYGVDADGDGIIDTIALAEGGKVEVPDPPNDGDPINLGSGGTSNMPPMNGDDEYCQDFDVDFVPKTPTVLVLVDRSSSMFGADDFWGTLKGAVLPVIEDLQGDVRFGFASYTGTEAMCQGLNNPTPFALDNYAAIQSAYEALGNPIMDLGANGETPTPLAIEQATELLLADDSPGDRYILLVSDGDPDFCDNPAPQCAADALVARLQLSAAAGVRTLVFGIENDGIQNPEWFDYFAQAGMGELPAWPDALDIGPYTGKLQSECNRFVQWQDYREAIGNTPDPTVCNTGAGQNQPPEGNADCYLPAADYSAVGGTAEAFLSTDTAALAAQIQATVSGLKSCVFDLSESGVEVVEGQEETGEIFVNEVQIPLDQWRMNDTQTLELLGAACETWQDPDVTKFFAGFPCEALMEVVK